MTATGFKYFWDFLGLPTENYLVHYDFNAQSGTNIPSVQGANPRYSGTWTGVSVPSNYNNYPSSGYFDGNSIIAINHAEELYADNCTHIFIYEKSGLNRGTLFSSLNGSPQRSGYNFGVTDNNKLYYEGYSQAGPVVQVSSQMYRDKNAVAIVRSSSSVNMYSYDFGSKTVVGERITNPLTVGSFSHAYLGGGFNLPADVQNQNFQGWLDEYIYISQPITPNQLNILFSGFYSNYSDSPPIIGHTGYIGVTGVSYQFTGITGVTGYFTSGLYSGIDVFGDPIYTYTNVPLTGYLMSGLNTILLTGYIVQDITGDASGRLVIDDSFGADFGYSNVTYLRNVDHNDFSVLNVVSGVSNKTFNRTAQYDRIARAFELDQAYDDAQIQIYLNGISQVATGYYITGDIFSSGLVPSGDYILDGYIVNSTSFYDNNDTLSYDIISGNKQRVFTNNFQSGSLYPISSATYSGGRNVFFNGVLLIAGNDFAYSGNNLKILTNQWNGETGALTIFDLNIPVYSETGNLIFSAPTFQAQGTQLFLNGQKQLLGADYIENSSFDLLGASGLFRSNFSKIYHREETYWEQ